MNASTKAALYQDVMVVGVNYRLGAWGFFYLNEMEDGQDTQGTRTPKIPGHEKYPENNGSLIITVF